VMVNTAAFFVIVNFKKKDYSVAPAVLASFLVFISLIYGNFRLNNIFTGERLKVAVVQGNIPQDEKWDMNYRESILAKYETLTKEAAKERPDLIVWPETSVPGFLESEEDISARIKNLAAAAKTPLLVGTIREDKERRGVYYNSATLLSGDGRLSGSYDKVHLVPFGEYIPFKGLLSFAQKFAKRPIGDVTKGEDYKVFKFFIERHSSAKDANRRLIKAVKFSCLICFEDIFPEISRKFVKEGAAFLVNITNDAWYKKTSAAYQHAESSVFRAVENRTNIVRAANTGYSCFIDQKGRIADAVKKNAEDLFVDGFKSREITLAGTRTFYNTYGDLFAYLCIIFALIQIRRRYIR